MRIAIVSDIHGNGTALEAVVADLRQTAPDLVLHGGDLAGPGSSPAEVVDRIRDLGWQGVVGNADEMLFRPESLRDFSRESPNLQAMFRAIEEMAAATRETLGDERLAWLGTLPLTQVCESIALVHASPQSPWRSPAHMASDGDMEATYGSLGSALAIYGHIHVPFVRRFSAMTLANSGSAGLPYDGDQRASYLLVDELQPEIRRVEYDIDREMATLLKSGLPHSNWVARMLASAGPQMP